MEKTYHQTRHSTTEQSPLERYRQAIGTLRQIPEDVNIEPLFYTRKTRVVRKDGTVIVDKVLYEVPLHLRGLQVELRYDPFALDHMEVWHDKRRVRLAQRVNRIANSELAGGTGEHYER